MSRLSVEAYNVPEIRLRVRGCQVALLDDGLRAREIEQYMLLLQDLTLRIEGDSCACPRFLVELVCMGEYFGLMLCENDQSI